MKFKHTQLTVLSLFSLLSLALIYGCKKEDPLTPNKDMEKFQTEDYAGGTDIGGGFGDTTGTGGGNGGGNDGGGNDGGSAPSPYFRADIDGSQETFSIRTFSSSSMGVTVSASQGGSSVKSMVFSIIGQPTKGDTIDLSIGQGQYIERLGINYVSKSGYLVFDEIENSYVQGTFKFIGEMPNNSMDTVIVESGEFAINR